MSLLSVNGAEFVMIRLLGKGKGGYSYLVERADRQYVLKQIHHEPCDYYQFGDKLQAELADYARLRKIGIRMPELIDVDVQKEKILKEYIDGPTVLDLVRDGRAGQEYFDQIEKMCELLYKNNTNIDYFPTNFIVQDGLLFYVDYECNDYLPEWNFANWGIKYWSMTEELMSYLREH